MAKAAKPTEFWRLFVERLRALGISQTEVSDQLGMSRQAVNAWGRGALPSRETIERLAEILDWRPADILAAVAAGAPAAVHQDSAAGHVVRRDLVQRFGVDEELLSQRMAKALEAFVRELGTKAPRQVSSPYWGADMEPEQFGPGQGREIWNALTPEQRYGLALLIEGRHVDMGDMRTALRVLGLLRAPVDERRVPTAVDGGASGVRELVAPTSADRARKRPRSAR